jgi:hypothetical protein
MVNKRAVKRSSVDQKLGAHRVMAIGKPATLGMNARRGYVATLPG